jgi:cytochrome c2
MNAPVYGPLAAAILWCTAGCSDAPPSRTVPGGDAMQGREVVVELQCGACHIVPGIRSARGRVGPTLERFAHRPHLAGKWPNEPDHLLRWLRDPPAMAPHTAMPALVHDDATARDVAAFLYTLQ